MQLNIFRRSPLEQLIADIPENIENYSSDEIWIDKYFSEKSMDHYFRYSGLTIPDFDLKIGGSETDAENAEIMYEALRGILNPRQASDLRLWAFLTHKNFYHYMVRRWPINVPDSTDEIREGASAAQKVCDRISTRFFFGLSTGKAYVRQGLSRLYWSASLTYDEDNSNPYEITKYFLEKQDCFVAATERTLARNKTFLLAALKVLKETGDISRSDTRMYFAEINRSCGIGLLDSLSSKNAYELCKRNLDYVMNLPPIQLGSIVKVKEIDSGSTLLLTACNNGVKLGNTLLPTSPKNIRGLKPGSRFSYGKKKIRVKVADVENG